MTNDQAKFAQVNQQIIDDIIKELRLQGHSLTGALEKSFKAYEVDEGGNIILTASALEYLEQLETGLQPNQIDVSMEGIKEMTRYVELRMGYRGDKAIRVALLILKRQSKEGNPTKNSYQYSKTGERTEIVKDTFYKNENQYGNKVDNVAVGQLDNNFNEIKSGTV